MKLHKNAITVMPTLAVSKKLEWGHNVPDWWDHVGPMVRCHYSKSVFIITFFWEQNDVSVKCQ